MDVFSIRIVPKEINCQSGHVDVFSLIATVRHNFKSLVAIPVFASWVNTFLGEFVLRVFNYFCQKLKEMEGFSKKCFVCQKEIAGTASVLNMEVNLPECIECQGTEDERKKIAELLDSLADGFVCGCI